jgi:hypothetical protein
VQPVAAAVVEELPAPGRRQGQQVRRGEAQVARVLLAAAGARAVAAARLLVLGARGIADAVRDEGAETVVAADEMDADQGAVVRALQHVRGLRHRE